MNHFGNRIILPLKKLKNLIKSAGGISWQIEHLKQYALIFIKVILWTMTQSVEFTLYLCENCLWNFPWDSVKRNLIEIQWGYFFHVLDCSGILMKTFILYLNIKLYI